MTRAPLPGRVAPAFKRVAASLPILAAALAGLGLTHATGAPVPTPGANAGGAAPSPLWISIYAVAMLMVSGIFWLILGVLVATFFRHLDKNDTSRRPRGN
jgi:predicted cobalt transporter CbtA